MLYLINNYDEYKLASPDHYDNDQYECDCCTFIGPESAFTDVHDDGRTLWVCETCRDEQRYK